MLFARPSSCPWFWRLPVRRFGNLRNSPYFTRSSIESNITRLPLQHLQSQRGLHHITPRLDQIFEEDHLKKMFYSEFHLDRAEHLRTDPSQLEALEDSTEARLVPWMDSKCLFKKEDSSAEIFVPVTLIPLSKFRPFLNNTVGSLFLGLDPESKAPFFAGLHLFGQQSGVRRCKIGCVQDLKAMEEQVLNDDDQIWVSVRSVGFKISRSNAALVAAVNGLMEFHMNHQFCGKTGLPLSSSYDGRFRKRDTEDKTEERNSRVFPRIDPAVICLVTQGEYCLLGRKPSWQNRNRYSCLAGFLEIGETFEQAVEREVFEESGIKVDVNSVEYVGSQPWPFPQSVMIGFKAKAIQSSQVKGLDRLQGEAQRAAEEIGITAEEVDYYLGVELPKPIAQVDEMEDVRWFHYNFLKHSLDEHSDSRELTIPDKHAIANKIIQSWMSEKGNERTPWLGDLFPDVVIDHGRFKYILVRLVDGDRSKIIVRGLRGRAYHQNILDEVQAEAGELGFKGEVKVLGGGRIEHDEAQREVFIYGYSSAFGTGLHDITAVLCKWRFPFYDNISVSYSGY